MDYDIELYGYGAMDDLREVYAKSFGQSGNPAYFKWKYLDNPAGNAISFVARHKGMIAAFYGVIPEYYLVNGHKEIIHQSMDTMTHPDHRGKGLFPLLAKATFAHLREQSGRIHVIGYPGPTSYGGFVNKLQWRCIGQFKYLFVYKWSFAIASALGSEPSAVVEHISTFTDEWDAYFQEHYAPSRSIEKHIDRDFLMWRIVNNPGSNFSCLSLREKGVLIGYCIYRLDKAGRLFIHQLDMKRRELYAQYIPVVLRYLFNLPGVKAVHTFLASMPELEKAYRGSGFMSNPVGKGPFSYRTPFIVLADERPDVKVNDIRSYAIQPITRDY